MTHQTSRLTAYSHMIHALLGAWIAGSAVGLHVGSLPGPWIWAFVGVGLFGLVLESNRPWITRIAVVVVVALLALLITFFRVHHIPPSDILRWAPTPQAHLEGMITHRQVKDTGNTYRLMMDVLSINGQYATGHLMVWKIKGDIPPIGSHVAITGQLRAPKPAAFEHGFNEAVYLRSKGVTAVLNRPAITQVLSRQASSSVGAVQQGVERLQQKIQHTFEQHLSPLQAQLLGGVVLGDRAIPMQADTRDHFIQTGLIHFLAASGFNVGVVAGALLLLLRPWQAHERWKLMITGLFVVAYMALAGLSPSVVRAGSMVLLAFLFRGMNHHLTPLTLLLMAVGVLVLWHPAILDDIGFQLSALTTLGIITMVPPVQQWAQRFIHPWISGVMVVPLMAQLWVIPISVTVFNQLPLHSVFLNVFAALCVTPLTLIGFTAAAITPIWHGLAAWVCLLAKPFAWILLWIVNVGAQFDQWVLHPTSPPVWVMWGSYACLIWMAWVLHQPHSLGWTPHRKILAAALFPILLSAIWGGQIWADRQNSHVTLFHPSEYTWALDVRPKHRSEHFLFLEKPVGYWEQRNITEYARHHLGYNLTSIVYLTGNAEQHPAINNDTITPRMFLSLAEEPATAGQLTIVRDESRAPVVDGDTTYRITRQQNTDQKTCLLLITDDTRRTFECEWTLYHYPNRPVVLFTNS